MHLERIIQLIFALTGITNTVHVCGLLKVGDKAPRLTVARWIKGQQFNNLDSPGLYVVEFGFITCPPCQASIPELNELTKKYQKQVSVISIHVFENISDSPSDLSYIKRVQNYVSNQKQQLYYNIAVDVPEKTTAKEWLTASRNDGVPVSFVVKNRNIIWIGSPFKLFPIFDYVIADNFDYLKYAAEQKTEEAEMDSYWRLIKNEPGCCGYEKLLSLTDSLLLKFPSQQVPLNYQKYMITVRDDEKKTSCLIKMMLAENTPAYNGLMLHIGQRYMDSPKHDLGIAEAVFTRAFESSFSDKLSAIILDNLATVFFEKKEFKKAVEMEKKAIKLLKKAHGNLNEYNFYRKLAKYKKLENHL